MRGFDNYPNKDSKTDDLNNQNLDRYSNYNNYNNSNSSNSVFKNLCINNAYDNDNDYNKALKNREELYKCRKKEAVKNKILFFVLVLIVLGVFVAFWICADSGDFNVSQIVQKNADKIFVIIMGFVFGLAGLAMLLYPIINKRIKMKRCKYLVKATIVDFKVSYDSEGHSSSHPVYQFCYNGETYTVTNSMSLVFGKPEIGTQVDIFINEDNPNDFYAEIKSYELFFVVFGLTFMLAMWASISTVFQA